MKILDVPTALECAEYMLPYLALLSNAGWPGLSERDRGDMCNLRADLESALVRERAERFNHVALANIVTAEDAANRPHSPKRHHASALLAAAVTWEGEK